MGPHEKREGNKNGSALSAASKHIMSLLPEHDDAQENTVNHIVIDSQDEAVKRFFLSLPVEPQGSIVELNGQAVACVVPPPKSMNGSAGEWNDAKNERRCDLIDREFQGPPLTPAEMAELAVLQDEMLRYRQRVAPLPIEDARRLHQELLARVAAQGSSK